MQFEVVHYNIIFLDEFVSYPANIADMFFSFDLAILSSGKKTKLIIVSTLHGMNIL